MELEGGRKDGREGTIRMIRMIRTIRTLRTLRTLIEREWRCPSGAPPTARRSPLPTTTSAVDLINGDGRLAHPAHPAHPADLADTRGQLRLRP